MRCRHYTAIVARPAGPTDRDYAVSGAAVTTATTDALGKDTR